MDQPSLPAPTRQTLAIVAAFIVTAVLMVGTLGQPTPTRETSDEDGVMDVLEIGIPTEGICPLARRAPVAPAMNGWGLSPDVPLRVHVRGLDPSPREFDPLIPTPVPRIEAMPVDGAPPIPPSPSEPSPLPTPTNGQLSLPIVTGGPGTGPTMSEALTSFLAPVPSFRPIPVPATTNHARMPVVTPDWTFESFSPPLGGPIADTVPIPELRIPPTPISNLALEAENAPAPTSFILRAGTITGQRAVPEPVLDVDCGIVQFQTLDYSASPYTRPPLRMSRVVDYENDPRYAPYKDLDPAYVHNVLGLCWHKPLGLNVEIPPLEVPSLPPVPATPEIPTEALTVGEGESAWSSGGPMILRGHYERIFTAPVQDES